MVTTEAQMQAIQEAEDIDTGVDTRTKKEMVDDQMSAFSATAKTAAEMAPVIGDAIAVYNLPSDLRKAYELIQQGYTEGDIKDIGLGAGLAGLSALGVVPVLGAGARVAKKGLRKTIDDALVQTEDLFRTASGMDGPDSMAMATTAPSRVTGNVADDALPDTSITKIIIGKSGKDHAEKQAKYNAAKQQLTGGRSVEPDEAQELWNRTGAQEDLVHGDVVYEIPTVNARLKENELTKTVITEFDFSKKDNRPDEKRLFQFQAAPDAGITVGDILDFPELFEQAPYLKDVRVKEVPVLSQLGGTKGAYDEVENVLYLSSGTKKDIVSTMLHELEHAVQTADGFTYRGANVERFLGADTGYDSTIHRRLTDERVRRAENLSNILKRSGIYDAAKDPGKGSSLGFTPGKFAVVDLMKMLADVQSPKRRKRFIQVIKDIDETEIQNLRVNPLDSPDNPIGRKSVASFKDSLPAHVRDFGNSLSPYEYRRTLEFLKKIIDKPSAPIKIGEVQFKKGELKSPLEQILSVVQEPDFQDLARFDELKKQALIKYIRDPGEVTARNVQFRFLASQADPSITRVAPRFTEDKSIKTGDSPAVTGVPETKTDDQLREEASRAGVDLTPAGTYISSPEELARGKRRSAAEQTSEAIPVMPINQAGLEARGFDFKPGGEYVNPITKEILTGKKVGNANIKIVPGMEIRGGRPMAEFNVTDLDVPEVGSAGKGKTQILVNLIKPTKKGNKAGWAWDDVESKELEGVNTLVSVVHKGKHYFTLETDFSKGAELKTYPKSQSEPRLRPTAMGEIDLQEQVGTIRMKNKTHPVYRKITAFASGGLAMAKGGAIPMDRQMDMFDDGGLMDQGGSTDPVSGNDVPVGSLQEEVRDDIPAMLSEGEFVMPADVVRYHGLDKMMALRDEAKLGLARMEAMGQMGNAEEAVIPPDIPFGLEDLDIADDPLEMQVGGFVPQQQPYGTITQPGGQNVFSVPSQFQPQPIFAPFNQQQFAPAAPVTPVFGPGQPTGQPKETFTFDQLMPTSGGVSETREYRNADGKSLYIPFINGEPVYPIPEGYTEYKPDATPDPTPDPVTTTTAAAPKEEDPSRMTPEEQQRQREANERIRNRKAAAKELGYTKEASAIGQLAKMLIPGAGMLTGKEEPGTIMPDGSIADGQGNTFDPITGEQIGGKGFLGLGKSAAEKSIAGFEEMSEEEKKTALAGTLGVPESSVAGLRSKAGEQSIQDVLSGVVAPETTQVETTLQATQQASETASDAARNNIKFLNDVMNQLNIPENQKMDYLVKAAAGKGSQTFATGPARTDVVRVDFSTFTPEDSAAAQEVLDVIGTRGDDSLKSMLTSSREVAQAEVRPTAAASIYKEPDPAGDILPGEPGSDTAFDPVRQEEEDRQTQNYISKGYDEPRAKAAAKNKVAADNIAKQQARDRGESEEHIAKTTAVTDSSGKPVTTTSAVTGKTTVVTSEPEKDDSDSGSGKIVCTEMYRQTQLDDWKQAIKIWGVYEKKYLTPYHEKGYHWLFKPWVRGMQTSSILTSVGAYLAQARTQHLKHVMTKGKAPDSFVGNVWCKIIHPIVYIAGRTKEWLKL